MKHYRIGEIAEKAGISKRTIDYYTNLGLLKPVRSESNYRFYPEETFARLKIIEDLKSKRYTLEEIGENIGVLDEKLLHARGGNVSEVLNTDFLLDQVKQLQSQISQLQPALASMENSQQALSVKQKLLQSMALINAIIIYINEVVSLM